MIAFGIGFALAFLVSLAVLLIRRKRRAVPDSITLANAGEVVSFRVGERYLLNSGVGPVVSVKVTGINLDKGTFTVGDERTEAK